MKTTQNLLKELRQYAVDKKYTADILYHEEENYLMRFANSAISLNTSEHLYRFEFTAYDGKKRASYSLITSLDKVDEMKAGIDKAADMVKFVEPLSYQSSIPCYKEDYIDEQAYDAELANLTNQDRLDYFNKASHGLLNNNLQLAGIFASGINTLAMITTLSENIYYSRTTDAQITVVISHPVLKWEVIAEQSAQKKSDLQPQELHEELEIMIEHYLNDFSLQLPIGNYDIVFGRSAIAEILNYMSYISYHGGTWKRGESFLDESSLEKKIFSEKFTLTDDPSQRETFPFQHDLMGMKRKPFTIFEKGTFKNFLWNQEDADEFEQTPTGHTVFHNSIRLQPGNQPAAGLKDLLGLPREKDILYIPYIHYMNIVNPSEGIVTGSSRFGALLLRKDGTVEVPYNVRLTLSVMEIFGDKMDWLSSTEVANNISLSYDARNPVAIITPLFMKVCDLPVSHSNDSY